MNITEELIIDSCDNITYKNGIDHYVSDRVLGMHLTEKVNNYYKFTEYRIDAFVQALDDKAYRVDAIFNDKEYEKDSLKYNCTCQHFLDNCRRKNKFCEHIAAVMLKYSIENSKSCTSTSNSIKLKKIVQSYKGRILKASYIKKNVNLDLRYCYDEDQAGKLTSSVELAINTGKSYWIRNMRGFLNAIENEEEIQIADEYNFNYYKTELSDKDKKTIYLLLENLEIDNSLRKINQSLASKMSLISGRKIFLFDKQLYEFFGYIKEHYIEASINNVNYQDVKILEEDIPLSFNLQMNDGKILLIHCSELPISLDKDNRFFFYKNNIYVPSSKQLNAYIPFYNVFKKEKIEFITFNQEDCDEIAAYVIPAIRKISTSFQVDEILQNQLYEKPLEVTVFLDKEERTIVASIVYKYGKKIINSLNKQNTKNENCFVLRDMVKEVSVLAIMDEYGFENCNDKFILKDEEQLLAFLDEGILKLQQLANVLYSDQLKNAKLIVPLSYKASVRLNNSNLLEFEFAIDDLESEDRSGVLGAIREKKEYYKLKNGNFISTRENELQSLVDMLDYLDISQSVIHNGKAVLPKYYALFIGQTLQDFNMNYVKKNRAFIELKNNIIGSKVKKYDLPLHLDSIMRNYQKIGFQWFKTLSAYGFGGILADEMGLGKTLQTIAFIATEERIKPFLIIVPKSLMYNWKNEFEKFAPELKIIVISGNKSERELLRKSIDAYDVVVTSYPVIRNDIDEYKDMEFQYCILDEAQHIKNPSSKNAISVKQIKAKGYFALTGTPMENSLTEIWSIFDFVMKGYLVNHDIFLQKYEIPIIKNNDKKSIEILSRQIKPFMLRRLKEEVVKELPSKIEHKLIIEMGKEQKEIYIAYLNAAKKKIYEHINEVGLNKSKMMILSALTRLRQICCDPTIFIDNYQGESCKMDALDELLDECINGGHRVLVFSQFTSVLKNIGGRLEKNEIDYLYLDGKVKAEERGKLVDQFNGGNSKVFLISLKAGGTGLNLTGADTVIHFDPWWNPAVENQATDRAHRIGQNKNVEVIKLITKGTIEEKICELQEKKRKLINDIIDKDMNDNNIISKMNIEDIEKLFDMIPE